MYKARNRFLLLVMVLILGGQSYVAAEYRLPSGERLQDPTRPQQIQANAGEVRAEQAANFTLNYILTKGDERRAMINGKKVVEGDQVAGARVKRIEGDRVVLSYQGKLRELRLNEVTGIKRN